MDQLVLGDLVRDNSGIYTPILSFAHRDVSVKTTYVVIETNSSVLHVSPDHLLFGNDLILNAGSVKVGDLLHGVSEDMVHVVKAIRLETIKGAFAPITRSGHIVVSEVAVSSYVMVLNKIPAPYQHLIWHAAYSPLRLLCHSFPSSCVDESYDVGIANSITVFLPLQSFLNKSSKIVQFAAVGVVAPFALALWAVEQLLAVQKSAVGLIAVLFALTLFLRRSKRRSKLLSA